MSLEWMLSPLGISPVQLYNRSITRFVMTSPQGFPQCQHQFALLPTVHKGSPLPTFSPVFDFLMMASMTGWDGISKLFYNIFIDS